jgi:hypothetical protein
MKQSKLRVNNFPSYKNFAMTERFSKSSQQDICGTMKQETWSSSERLAWDKLAIEALELARVIPPGPERNKALKLAGLLRSTADARGLVFATRGRPRK